MAKKAPFVTGLVLLSAVAVAGLAALFVAESGGSKLVMASPVKRSEPAAFTGRRGINVAAWFTWTRQAAPDRYVFPAFQHQPGELAPGEARALRAAGFDFVRLPVEPGVFMSAAGADLDQATRALTAGIDRLRDAGLSVIVDMHPNAHFQPDPALPAKGVEAIQRGAADPAARRYAGSVAALAAVLDKRYGGTREVALELLNEPTLRCGAPSWRTQQAALHRAVRAAAPRLTLVLTGTCYDGIDGLTALNPADYADANALYTFHFYEDHRFTHQGSGMAGTVKGASGLPYPWNARDTASVGAELDARLAMLPDGGAADRQAAHASLDYYLSRRWDRAAIDRRLDQVTAWARAHAVPPDRILMGEFGVSGSAGAGMGARADDKARWLRDVREAAEARGFRWALWLYRGANGGADDFDLVDPATGALDPSTLGALGLTRKL